MPDPDLQAAQQAIDELASQLVKLTDPQGVLSPFEVDRQFFLLVKSRADRIQEECVEGRRRNRLLCAASEAPALLGQAAVDLRITRGNLSSSDSASLDKIVTRIEEIQDSVTGFTLRVQP